MWTVIGIIVGIWFIVGTLINYSNKFPGTVTYSYYEEDKDFNITGKLITKTVPRGIGM